MENLDRSMLKAVRRAANMITGIGYLLVALAERTASRAAESQAPAEGAVQFCKELLNIVADTIGPAGQRLEALADDWTPPGTEEPEPEG
jgi:hypothetical protein